jgi:hypothetical protein
MGDSPEGDRRMITARELIDTARSESGLDDFGDDYFREGLEKLVAAAHTDVKLTAVGEAAFRARNVAYLVSRLEIEDWYRRHPEIDDEEIVAPVFGLGLPRTGSTFVHALMAVDPKVRFLRTWESEKPCPPPTAETQYTDPRIAEMEAAQGGYSEIKRLAPEILNMLPMSTVEDPAECHDLLSLTLRGQGFVNTILFSYLDWLMSSDMVPAYRYHKRALKLLQWRCPPKRWRLKAPEHSDALAALATVYPDARFVVTHRDVVASIPSMAFLLAAINAAYVNGMDLKALGVNTAHRWCKSLDAMDAFRDTLDAARFFDVGFRRAQSEPIAVIREMYAWLGEPFTPAYAQRMADWRTAHPRNKQGSTKIDLARYGLSEDFLRQTYARYLARYRRYIDG